MNMIILKAWTSKFSFISGLLVMAIVLLWPALSLGSLDIWLQTIGSKCSTKVLYPIFAFLAGSYAALYIYNRKVMKCCGINATKVSAAPALLGIFLGTCPACIPALAFFLPLSLSIAIGYYSWIILLVSIALILFSLWRAGGFQKYRP